MTKALDGNWTGDPELAVFLLEGPYPKAERERLIKLVELTDIVATRWSRGRGVSGCGWGRPACPGCAA